MRFPFVYSTWALLAFFDGILEREKIWLCSDFAFCVSDEARTDLFTDRLA